MKKLFIPFFVPLIILILLRILIFNPQTAIHRFYNSYGFTLSEKIYSSEKITLPSTLTPVYNTYNKIQKKAGLDITPYLGKTVKKYTFKVENFPFKTSSEVYANILIYNNKIIAADIMTTSLGGFMLSPADEVFKIPTKT